MYDETKRRKRCPLVLREHFFKRAVCISPFITSLMHGTVYTWPRDTPNHEKITKITFFMLWGL